MSEPIPESIPTSQDPRSKRPLKRRALTPLSEQANQIDSLFKDPSKEIRIPEISRPRTAANLAPPPEIVANVQGSSAGAGSGEFHVYKASRRRENERVRLMEDELKREKDNEEFERRREEMRRKDEEKTEKNRKKREKRKGKGKQKGGGAGKAVSGPSVAMKDTGDSEAAGCKEENATNGAGEGVGEAQPEERGVIIHDED